MYVQIPQPLSFQWDRGNRAKNKEKHNVTIEESEEVFFNNPILFPDNVHSDVEDRFVAFGKTKAGRLLSIFFTIRTKNVRIISARDQSKKEKEKYMNYLSVTHSL